MTEPAQTPVRKVEPTVEDLTSAELDQVGGGARNGNLQITQFYYGAAQPAA